MHTTCPSTLPHGATIFRREVHPNPTKKRNHRWQNSFPSERTSPASPWRTTAQQMQSREWRRCSTDECVVAGLLPCLVLVGVPSLPFAACAFCPCASLADQTFYSSHLLATRFPCPQALARSLSHRHPPRRPPPSHHRCEYCPALLPTHKWPPNRSTQVTEHDTLSNHLL